MVHSRVLFIYVFLIIFFADAYFVAPWLRPITIMNYVLVFLYISGSKKKVPQRIEQLIKMFYVFSIYIFVIDLYQNDLNKAFSTIITVLPVPIVFKMFYTNVKNGQLVYFYAKWFLIYNGFFSVLQFFGIYLTAGELLSAIPLLDVDIGFAKDAMSQGLRISGAGYSTIGLACNLGAIFLYFYYNKVDYYSKKTRATFLLALVFFMLLTQTRSLLFALIPVIVLTNTVVNEKKFLRFILPVVLFAVVAYLVFLPYLQETFPRLFLGLEDDGSVIHRIQANVFGIVGTFYQSPIIGVSFDSALETMRFGYKKIGLFIGAYFIDEVTQHNQPAYYFRYYGFIGFILYVLIYYLFVKVGLQNFNSSTVKKVVFSVVVFHLLYTFSHNNKFTYDLFLWIFVSLNSFVYYNFHKSHES